MQETITAKEQNKELLKPENDIKPKEQKKIVFNFSFSFLVHLMHFLFRTAIALFIFYLVGNYHNFLDKNQLTILKALQSFASLSTIVSLAVFILQLVIFLKKSEATNIRAPIRSVLFLIVSVLLVIFSSVIIVISKM